MSIEAMKQALEALEDVQEMMNTSQWFNDRVTALRQAIEQADKQEPVGFVHPEDLQSVTLGHNSYAAIYVETEGHTGGIPLYTAQPQHEWVGLTNEEIIEIDNSIDSRSYSLFTYTRAIEAKIREKNHG